MKKIVHVVVPFAIIIVIWELAVRVINLPEALFPSPGKVVKAFGELWNRGLAGSSSDVTLFGHILVSLKRFFTGYFLSVVVAVILGMTLGWFPKIFAYVNPVLQLLRPIAPVAWMPFIVLWFGIGDTPAIVIIFLAGFFQILLSSVAAIGNMNPVYLKVAKNFGISGISVLGKIVFPAIFPEIMNSLHIALSTAWIFLVSGEMVGAQSGLGFLIMDSKNCLRADALLATMIVIGIIGLLLDCGMKKLERVVAKHWGVGAAAVVQAD